VGQLGTVAVGFAFGAEFGERSLGVGAGPAGLGACGVLSSLGAGGFLLCVVCLFGCVGREVVTDLARGAVERYLAARADDAPPLFLSYSNARPGQRLTVRGAEDAHASASRTV
jgi:hypothetical protein